jgi:hypothetical protein
MENKMGPNESRITLTPEQEKHISEIQPEEMKEYLRTIAESQGLIYRDAFDHNVIHEIEGATPVQSAPVTKRILVDGKSLEFSGTTELDVERAIGDFYRGEQAARENGETTRQAAPTATGSAEQAAANVELELRFKRGETSAKDYIEQSGAVDEYLESRGISVENLRVVSSERFEQSWSDATQEFLNGPAGSDWPGGNENLEIIGQKLRELGLVDAEDKVAALAEAYASMKTSGEVQKNPEIERNQAIASANSPSELKELLSQGRAEYHTIYGR